MIELRTLTPDNVERAREWRNQSLVSLRTPFALTVEMQQAFYRDVICNRQSPHRYWGLWEVFLQEHQRPMYVGMGGLTNIQWENGLAEISLIVDPDQAGRGIGQLAVRALLEEGFDRLRLETICGEVILAVPPLAAGAATTPPGPSGSGGGEDRPHGATWGAA